MKRYTKLLAILLILCVLFAFFSLQAFAENDANGGTDAGNGGNDAGGDDADGNDAGGNDVGGNDAGGNDASRNDAGGNDAGGNDAGRNDAGGNDAGGNDVGGSDAGSNDAGGNDAGGNDGNGDNNDAAGEGSKNVMLLTVASGEGEDQTRNAGAQVSYTYNAELYTNDSDKTYDGVYGTKLDPNALSAEEAKTQATIGAPSIADANLPDAPTTESPAIIQGAAVGYETRVSPTQYEPIEGAGEKPDPYNEFKVTITEVDNGDGTTTLKPSGFDGTYVIYRLDVSEFYDPDAAEEQYLHMQQNDNKALIPAATIAKPAAGTATTVKPEDYTPTNSFTDGMGNRSASYLLSDLMDANDGKPYVDVIVFATAANVAGADAGQENVPNGDVPLAFYVDNTLQYNDALTEYDPSSVDASDPNASAAYDKSWHEKFFDALREGISTISHYLVKGSDLALETMVEDSAGENKDSGTTYWSLEKSFQEPYYDLPADTDANDRDSCGRTVKLMSEVAVTDELSFGAAGGDLRKRTLDVNSFDVQVASNTTQGSTGILLENAWLTIADMSNTTGAEVAIGNNAVFTIGDKGKLFIDETCQLEIEWDGATTTPAEGETQPAPAPLNNGMLNLLPGGEIINNGVITIEGTEGKPIPDGQTPTDADKGCGELTVSEGAALTNNGALVVYGKLYNLGALVNTGKYSDEIVSNDPDKGRFVYHKGILVSWKDDVTQQNVVMGSLINGKDRDGKQYPNAVLENRGDILLNPGMLQNYSELLNTAATNLYLAVADQAIIPINPDPANPAVVTKLIDLIPPVPSVLENWGTVINDGNIVPASVAQDFKTLSLGAISVPGAHPELFSIVNHGAIINNGYIYVYVPEGEQPIAIVETPEGAFLYLYRDSRFVLILPSGVVLYGSYRFVDGALVFTFSDGTAAEPVKNDEGNWVYSFTTASGLDVKFTLTADFVECAHQEYETLAIAA